MPLRQLASENRPKPIFSRSAGIGSFLVGHYINFGKFYLESYGAAAEWTQIKEAFEHWNITGSNAFSKTEENQLDVTALEKVATVIEKIGKALSNLSKDKNA